MSGGTERHPTASGVAHEDDIVVSLCAECEKACRTETGSVGKYNHRFVKRVGGIYLGRIGGGWRGEVVVFRTRLYLTGIEGLADGGEEAEQLIDIFQLTAPIATDVEHQPLRIRVGTERLTQKGKG